MKKIQVLSILLLALALLGCDLSAEEMDQARKRCAEWRNAHAPGGRYTCLESGLKMDCEVSGSKMAKLVILACTPDGCAIQAQYGVR